MTIWVDQPESVEAFLGRAAGFLAAREAEHNLLFGISSAILTNPGLYPERRFAVVIRDDESSGPDRVVGAALQTPPRNLVLSEFDDPAAIDPLVDALVDVPLPGVTGPTAVAADFVRHWTERTGQPARLSIAERIYQLTLVRAPRQAPGLARAATEQDRETLIDWFGAFYEEALGERIEPTPESRAQLAAQLDARRMLVWDVDGAPVSMTGVSGPTPNGIRVGPVYTPPDERRRGYAGNLVAAASQAELDAGRRFVFLFTDLANPTSNHVYQEIGYEPVADVDQWQFLQIEPAADSA